MKADSVCVDAVRPAVNFNDRKSDIDILLLHYTGMNGGQAAEDWLCAEESGVSCHYIIHEDGRIVQMVAEADRAYHAGAGSWEGREDVNSRAIGVEIVNDGHGPEGALPPPFPVVQMQAVAALSRDIIARHAVAPHRVLAHSDTAPGRKIDPGETFDWDWLAEQGVGQVHPAVPVRSGRFLTPGENGQPVEALQAMLAMFGYGIEPNGTYDERTRIVVEAFQRHHRRALVDGVADASTIETIHGLLAMR
ncbi:MAG: N-acetylmuramoyl-L-alanine amidase [Pseudomonadota bacterium]